MLLQATFCCTRAEGFELDQYPVTLLHVLSFMLKAQNLLWEDLTENMRIPWKMRGLHSLTPILVILEALEPQMLSVSFISK